MKALLSVLVAAAFAVTAFNAAAQKEVTTKAGDVPSKQGPAVTTKEVKEKPKGGTMPKMKAKAKKEKPAQQEVKTKSSGNVTDKKKEEVKANK